MADDQNEIRISITLDDGSVREGFARIQKSGEDASNHLAESFNRAKNELLALIGAYVSFEAAKKFIESATEAATNYDKALNDMLKSLSSAGSYTDEAAESFKHLSEQIEATTTISATHALTLEALARNYARTNEQAIALTKAAIDLGAATGKGPEVALQQLGGTLDGTAGRIGKLIPQIKSLTEYQLRAGEAIGIVAQRFKDSASLDLNTYQGAVTKLANAFESLLVTIGTIGTRSPGLRAAIAFITGEINTLNKSLGQVKNDDVFGKILIQVTNTGIAITTFLIAPIEYTVKLLRVVLDSFSVIAGAYSGLKAQLEQALVDTSPGKVLSKFLDNDESKQARKQAVDDWKQTLQDFKDSTAQYNNFDISAGIVNELERMKEAVANAKGPLDSINKNTNDIRENALGLSGEITSVGQSFELMAQGASGAMELLKNDSVKAMQDIGAAAVKSLGGGVAQGMAAVGRAAVQGKDLFKAFAGAMVSALGSALIQMGTGYIMIGLAREFASYGADPTGYELIGIGSAMAALGGVLEAVGSGVGGGASSSASAGGGGGSTSGAPVDNGLATQVQQPQKQVTVNIHGSVFDTKETGLRIVELVNDAFNTQGAQVLVK